MNAFDRPYPVRIFRDEDLRFHASITVLKGMHSQGNTLEEALQNLHGMLAKRQDTALTRPLSEAF